MRILIRVDGTEVKLEERVYSFAEIYKLIDCTCVDLVHLVDGVHVMVVDDNGLLLNKPINEKATRHYWEKCGGWAPTPIVGAVVIVPEADYADEEEETDEEPQAEPGDVQPQP